MNISLLLLAAAVTARNGDMYVKLTEKLSDMEDIYNVRYFAQVYDKYEYHLDCLDDTSFATVEKLEDTSFQVKEIVVSDKKLKKIFQKARVNLTLAFEFEFYEMLPELRPYLHVQGSNLYANAYLILPPSCLPDTPSSVEKKIVKKDFPQGRALDEILRQRVMVQQLNHDPYGRIIRQTEEEEKEHDDKKEKEDAWTEKLFLVISFAVGVAFFTIIVGFFANYFYWKAIQSARKREKDTEAEDNQNSPPGGNAPIYVVCCK